LEKLFTFSHNSQNRDPFDTQLAFKRMKAHFPDAKRRTSNEKHGRDPLIAFVTSPRAADFVAARQRLKTGEGKFAPDAALNGRSLT
jgi:hypothetical protein